MTARLGLRLGAGRQDGRHALLVAERQCVVKSGIKVGAVDAVAPGLVARGVGEGTESGPGHLGRPLLLLRGGKVVEADLGEQSSVANNTVPLYCMLV